MSQKKFKETHLPCPKCESSDAYAIAEDGHGYCFSCQYYSPPLESGAVGTKTNNEKTHGEIFSYEYLPWRGISRDTMRFFDAKTKVLEDGKPHSIIFPYGAAGGERSEAEGGQRPTKHRLIDNKEFWSKGPINKAGLFGKDKFSAGSSKSITIVEGETDCLSTYQLLGSKYPVLGVQSATSALRDCTTDYEYLNSFERIYLCFDNDEPGKKAAKQVASLFNYSKVYFVSLTLKDPNEYLQSGKVQDFRNIWYNSKKFLPDNISSSLDDFVQTIKEDKVAKGVPFPWDCLTEKTQGIRTGEVLLVTALEGVGKTEFIRSIEHSILKTTEHPIAIIHLEENKARSLKGLAGLELKRPCHIDQSGVTDEAISEALRHVVNRDDRLYIYNHFGSDDPDVIVGIIRFLVTACGCRYVFLDHITMVVSGSGEDDRLPLDSLSTKLGMLVEELDFGLVLVSHVNDEGKTRGSRNISKIAATWIELSRDLEAESEAARNTTWLKLKKNRFFGETGPAGKLMFDKREFRLKEEKEVFKMAPV